MSLPRFSPTFDLGSFVGAMLVTLGTVSGWFWAAHSQFDKQSADIQLVSQRLDEDEKFMAQAREDQRSRDDRVSATLDKIDDEIKALIAQKANEPRR